MKHADATMRLLRRHNMLKKYSERNTVENFKKINDATKRQIATAARNTYVRMNARTFVAAKKELPSKRVAVRRTLPTKRFNRTRSK
jgi:hypothetical protein